MSQTIVLSKDTTAEVIAALTPFANRPMRMVESHGKVKGTPVAVMFTSVEALAADGRYPWHIHLEGILRFFPAGDTFSIAEDGTGFTVQCPMWDRSIRTFTLTLTQ